MLFQLCYDDVDPCFVVDLAAVFCCSVHRPCPGERRRILPLKKKVLRERSCFRKQILGESWLLFSILFYFQIISRNGGHICKRTLEILLGMM